MTTKTETLNAYQLAYLADCGVPDTRESLGAQFLLEVQEATAARRADFDGSEDMTDVAHEIADGAASIYSTIDLWRTFVDLAGFREDVSDLGFEFDCNEAEKYPMTALYLIADRLASALLGDTLAD